MDPLPNKQKFNYIQFRGHSLAYAKPNETLTGRKKKNLGRPKSVCKESCEIVENVQEGSFPNGHCLSSSGRRLSQLRRDKNLFSADAQKCMGEAQEEKQ